ncbi:MAG: hypothetical protein C0623_03580 [Desulfuromonas sp.]|nr:MAG: hypothetical protein C0623_03580 [Desulfuromonas sp.]
MAAAMKLGELLVQEGVISPHQLEEALKYQVIFGGKLGTNLIELDFVREDDIAKTLSRMLRVPLVSGEELHNIPDDVIHLIPRDIAEQYQVVPFSIEHRKLTLVMANPSDLKAIDEISFRTGLIVRPAVAAEVRLILALEKYYHIPREIRYVQVSKKVEGSLRDELEVSSPDKVGNEIMPEEVPATVAPKIKDMETQRQKHLEARKKESEQEAIEKTKQETKKKTARTIKFEDDEDDEVIEEPPKPAAPERKPAAAPPKPAAPAKKPEPEPDEVFDLAEADIVEESIASIDSFSIEEVFKHLADPADREDIADSLIAHLGQEVDRAALFQIRGQVVQGWKLYVDVKPKTDFGQFQITLDHPSILKTVIDTASYYIGPIPKASADNLRLVESMGGNMPPTALLVPVIVMGRVVTIIYIDDKSADLPEKLLDLQKLAAKMAMSFEILILKNKILMM